jgi:hypothetical protein
MEIKDAVDAKVGFGISNFFLVSLVGAGPAEELTAATGADEDAEGVTAEEAEVIVELATLGVAELTGTGTGTGTALESFKPTVPVLTDDEPNLESEFGVFPPALVEPGNESNLDSL